MIIGSGLLATSLKDYFDKVYLNHDNYLIFASGVSNSGENRDSEFEREINLLKQSVSKNIDRTIIYFSSSALVNEKNSELGYYKHKLKMENLISKTNNFIILRLPQVIGDSSNKNTMLNFFISTIENDAKLYIKKNAYRYFVGIDDVASFLCLLIQNNIKNIMFNFANPYRYRVVDVIRIISKVLNKNYTNFELIDETDGYVVDFTMMNEFLDRYQVKFDFSEEYLEQKIKKLYVTSQL